MSTTGPSARSEQFVVGTRVVVRHRLPEPDGLGHSLTDALGEVLAVTSDAVVIRTRRGEVAVPLETITTAKLVPPAPARRPRPQPGV